MMPYSLLFNRGLFLLYLLLLAWAPLPLGSNRAWSWALLEIGLFTLSALLLLAWAVSPGMFKHALHRQLLPLVVLLLGLLYLGFQMLLLPLPVLEFLAPENASWWQQLAPAVSVDGGRLVASLDAAHTEGLKQCAYVAAFFLTQVLVNSDKRLRIVVYVMIAVALFEAVYGLAAHFMRGSFPLWTPTWYGHNWATGTFVNKNHYAAHLSFGIALTLGVCLAFVAKQPYRGRPVGMSSVVERLTDVLLQPGYLRFGVLMVLLSALFFSQSRGAFLGLAVAGAGLLAFGAYWRDYRKAVRRRSRVPSAEARVVPWLFFIALASAVWLSSSGLFGRLLPSELSDMGRLVTWQASWDMWLDHWLFGVGNGSFQYVFTQYRVPELDGSLYDFAHNDHLQLLVEQGLVGSALFYTFFALCWWRMLHAYCKRGRSKSRQGVLLGILIAVSAFFLHGFVDFNFHIPANALWFYCLLALGLVAASVVQQSRVEPCR